MAFTKTFIRTLKAFNKGKRYIINCGGSRSGKTYAELQLLDLLMFNPKPRIITTVSATLPHLEGGAIRDLNTILQARGVIPDDVRTKRPYIYQYGTPGSIHEFIGFDKPGKALGAARDILFINEGNQMSWEICHQLIQRTREAVFIDFNPSRKCWIEELAKGSDAEVIKSTYLDNIKNLTEGQIDNFEEGKRKAEEEAARGIYGYWSKWWSVYGLGEYGQLEDAIYTDYEIGEFNDSLPIRYGLDFGYSNDPDALVKVAIDEKRKIIYLHECFYKNHQGTDTLREMLINHCGRRERIIADNAEMRLIDDLKRDLNIHPCTKWQVRERVRKMQSYHLVITPESYNLLEEIESYVWHDKKSEMPIDKFNHLLDAAGYALTDSLTKPKPKITAKSA
jgi:phage terminase large subunit